MHKGLQEGIRLICSLKACAQSIIRYYAPSQAEEQRANSSNKRGVSNFRVPEKGLVAWVILYIWGIIGRDYKYRKKNLGVSVRGIKQPFLEIRFQSFIILAQNWKALEFAPNN